MGVKTPGSTQEWMGGGGIKYIQTQKAAGSAEGCI